MRIILLMVSFFISTYVFATGHKATQLVPGHQVLEDVANQEVITLILNTQSADPSLQPEVNVTKQWSGFSCQHKASLILNHSFNEKNKLFLYTWAIQMSWGPGADLSGCIVKVTFPGMPDSFAELFMNY